MTERLTWDQVRAWRVSRQHLDRRVPERKLVDVVRDVCGVHAQVQSSAELQICARVDGVTREAIREALWGERSLVRTWAMRGTLHLLTAEDLPVYVAALRQHDRWWKRAWLRMIGMTEDQLRATLEAIKDALGARPITRERLAEKVAATVGPHARDRMMSGWGEMLKPASFHGYLSSGPPRGQSVTFVRPDRWLGGWKEPDGEEAWREILGRYLRAYGPASREEFARWWGMQPAPAGRVLKASGDGLVEVDVEGHRGWFLADDLPTLRRLRLRNTVRLLPGFDVYVAGTRAMVAGVWSHERTNGRIKVTIDLFRKPTAAQKKHIGDEADRLGSFLGTPAIVSYRTTS
jgi:hypothetical protein